MAATEGLTAAAAVVSRRTALAGCAACLVLAAGCASYGPEQEPEAEPGGEEEAGGPATVEVASAEIPVGGGLIIEDAAVVVTQPSAGEFKAFSAVCTHQGCTVAEVGETIRCDCHGSQFSITDGSVVSPPATAPLESYRVEVAGNTVTVQT